MHFVQINYAKCIHMENKFKDTLRLIVATRLAKARVDAGFKSRLQATKKFRWNHSTYTTHENGRSAFNADTAKEYASAYQVPLSHLLGADIISESDDEYVQMHDNMLPPTKSPEQHSGIPLISWVSAGAMEKDEHYQEDFDDYPIAYAPDLDPNGDWIALRVDGRSMDKISPHDSIIFVNRSEKNLVPNACYVIIDENGDASYKRYSSPDKFEPVSTKPHDYETIRFIHGQEPEIIGRVRKTVLSM